MERNDRSTQSIVELTVPGGVAWGDGGPCVLYDDYELGYVGAERVVRAVAGAEPSTFNPFTRPSLSAELAALHEGSEIDVLAFVHRYGFLSHVPAYEPLSYIWREARSVRMVFSLLEALTAATKDDDPSLVKRIEDLIGKENYSRIRKRPAVWPFVKPTWREYRPGDPLYRDVRDEELELQSFGFATDPGGEVPAMLEIDDQNSPAAIARFLIRDLLNARVVVPSHHRFRGGTSIRMTVQTVGNRFVLATGAYSLVDAVYHTLIETTVRGLAVRACEECARFFIQYDPRQRFCAPRYGESASACAQRYRSRKHRLRAAV